MSARRRISGSAGREITVIEDPDEERRIVGLRAHHEPVATEESAGESEFVQTERRNPWAAAKGWLRMAALWVGVLLLIVETALSFRLAFALADANRGNGFVDFIFDVTGPLVRPFEGIIGERSVDGGVLEPQTIIAMIVWAVVALLLVVIISVARASPVPARESSTVTRERHRYVRKD